MFELSALGLVMKMQARNKRDEKLEYTMSGMKISVYVDKNGDIDEKSLSMRELTQEEMDNLYPDSPWREKE